MDSIFCVDNFVSTKGGAAIRILPFGKLVKGGVEREITPDVARKFRLPHFKPPIKLGSHDDETPAGGFIVGLEVGSDGLYAMTEWTEKGIRAMQDGDYRYQSPEILWSGGLENPETGEVIVAPLIIGTALLHTPHLGEAAALYSIEQGVSDMSENVTMPASWLDRLLDRFTARNDGGIGSKAAQDAPAIDVEKYSVIERERDEYKARVEQIEAERAAEKERAGLVAELQKKEKFGVSFIELQAASDAASMLQGMTPEQRDWVLKNFSALAKQVSESALLGEVGSEGEGEIENPKEALDHAVRAEMEAAKVDYSVALDRVIAKRPELFAAAYPRQKR